MYWRILPMNKRDFSKIRADVKDLELTIAESMNDIWVDPITREYYKKLLELELGERRLWLVYSLLDHSIIKTAAYFRADRKTVSKAITSIKEKLCSI